MSIMSARVRPMEVSDVPRVVEMDGIIFGHTLGEQTLIAELTEKTLGHYFVLEDDEGTFVGHIGLWIDVPYAQILNFYIIPKRQRQGYGKMLLEFALGYLEAFQVTDITLEVRKSNIKAQALYSRHAFQIISTRKQYYPDGEDAYVMLRRNEGISS